MPGIALTHAERSRGRANSLAVGRTSLTRLDTSTTLVRVGRALVDVGSRAVVACSGVAVLQCVRSGHAVRVIRAGRAHCGSAGVALVSCGRAAHACETRAHQAGTTLLGASGADRAGPASFAHTSSSSAASCHVSCIGIERAWHAAGRVACCLFVHVHRAGIADFSVTKVTSLARATEGPWSGLFTICIVSAVIVAVQHARVNLSAP